MLLLIDDAYLNETMRDTMKKTIEGAKRSHYTDVFNRAGGNDFRHDGDWIKNLVVVDDKTIDDENRIAAQTENGVRIRCVELSLQLGSQGRSVEDIILQAETLRNFIIDNATLANH